MNRIAVSNLSVSSRRSLRIWAPTVTSRGWVMLSATSSAGFEISASTIDLSGICVPREVQLKIYGVRHVVSFGSTPGFSFHAELTS